MYLFNVIEWANGEIILEKVHLSNCITSILLDEYCYRVSTQDITYVYSKMLFYMNGAGMITPSKDI